MPSAHSRTVGSTIGLSLSQPSKPISISLSSRSKASISGVKPSSDNPRKRPHSSLADDSDSDHERSNAGPQLVSAFDHSAGGAIGINGVPKSKAPLIIQSQKNRDWREESRRKRAKNILPAEVQALRAGQVPNGEDGGGGVTPAFGLTFVKKEGNGDVRTDNTDETRTLSALAQVKNEVKTDDEEALEALIGDRKKNSDLVVSLVDNASGTDGPFAGRNLAISEDDAFRLDVASRPDSASLDDYASVPVEEFGAALLRGMGWKDDAASTPAKSKARVVERRPALLGIGAKEVPGDLEEPGAWGKAAKGGKRKAEKTYNPVLLRNSRTGEMLTEEELKEKQEEGKREENERRERNLVANERMKERRRRGDERERERRSEDRRERGRRSEDKRDRRRGDERERERERERRHRKQDGRYDRHERERRRD